MSGFDFRVTHEHGAARLGSFRTPHGAVETPEFMPVGTHGIVRGIGMDEVAAAGAQMVLSNAYHLYLRPGDRTIRALGGLHAFTRWSGPMLTDSGGFQVFSLPNHAAVREEGIAFRSHLDGSMHDYTPESVIRIQRNLGADVIMQLDELLPAGADLAASRAAMERSLRWLERCRNEVDRIGREGREPIPELVAPEGAPPLAVQDAANISPPPQALFPIVQGGTHPELRRASAAGILGTGDWSGIAIGGLSVGEVKAEMHDTLDLCDAVLPRRVPRYLMGVGFPDDLVEGMRRGIDLFDCVAPTRLGRDGTLFTRDGKTQIKNTSNRTDRRPIVEGCTCPACTKYDRAYLRHLFVAREDLGLRLLALHNVTFLLQVMGDARNALRAGTFGSWSEEWLARYSADDAP